MKLKVLAVVLVSLLAVPSFGQFFEIGTAGFAGGVNNWPDGEAPQFVIDGTTEKYLNFGITDTGFAVIPASGSTIATSIEVWSANDAPERDPTTYEVWGSNFPAPSDISPGVLIPLAAFEQISTGSITLPADRNPIPGTLDFSTTISFANSDAYTSYLVVFPTVADVPPANSMQIAEVQLFDAAGTGIFSPGDAIIGGQVVPEPSAGILALLCMIPVMVCIRRRR